MNEEQIFADALEKSSLAERCAYLDAVCGIGNPLRERIDELLAAHETRDCLLDSPPLAETRHSSGYGQELLPSGPPKRIGEFEILREIGRGGMGIVYEARQVSLNRKVALKVLTARLGLTEAGVIRFKREAEAAARLHHTHVVPIYGTGESSGIHYFAMELIEGPSLDIVISCLREEAKAVSGERVNAKDRGQLPQWVLSLLAGQSSPCDSRQEVRHTRPIRINREYFMAIARMIADVAAALHHAHSRGVIHRDVKPSNLLVTPRGHLSLTDFGLALLLDQPGVTMTGEFMGTPLYMSPEQIAAGKTVDHRTDIYSLGATLYELIALRPPFSAGTRDGVIAQVLDKEPVSPRRFVKQVPTDLETIALKAIEKEPDKRYQSAGDFAEDLACFLHGHLIRAKRPTLLKKTVKYVRRNRAQAIAGASMFLLIGILSVTIWGYIRLRDTKADALVEQGLRLSSGAYPDFQGAINCFNDALQYRPAAPEVFLYRAGAKLEAGDAAGAAEDLKNSLRLQSEGNSAAHWLFARAALELGDSKTAEYHQRVASQQEPNSVKSLVVQALAMPFDERGIELLTQAIEQEPFEPLYYFYRGRIAYNLTLRKGAKRYFDLAVRDLEKSLKGLPGNERIVETLCLCLVQFSIDIGDAKQNYQRSRELLDEWLRRDPTNVSALAVHADWALRHNDDQTVETACAKGQQLDADRPEFLFFLGFMQLYHCDEPAVALDNFSLVIEKRSVADWDIYPLGLVDIYSQRAKCYIRLGEYELARKDLEIAQRKMPARSRNLFDWIHLVDAYRDCGDDDVCKSLIDEWIRLMPECGRAFQQRGRCEDDLDAAMADWQKAIRLGCGEIVSWFPGARLWAHPGASKRYIEQAVELARAGTVSSPYKGSMWTNLGIAQYRHSEYRSAIEAVEKGISLKGYSSADESFLLAMAHWQLGERQIALEHYNKAVAEFDGEQPDAVYREAQVLLGVE